MKFLATLLVILFVFPIGCTIVGCPDEPDEKHAIEAIEVLDSRVDFFPATRSVKVEIELFFESEAIITSHLGNMYTAKASNCLPASIEIQDTITKIEITSNQDLDQFKNGQDLIQMFSIEGDFEDLMFPIHGSDLSINKLIFTMVGPEPEDHQTRSRKFHFKVFLENGKILTASSDPIQLKPA